MADSRRIRAACAIGALSVLLGCDSKEPPKAVADTAKPIPHVLTSSFPVREVNQTRQAGGACNIDRINDKPRSPGPVSVSGSLAVYGWAAIDPKTGVVPDAVVVVLKGSDGSEKFALAVRDPREDVAKFFGQAKLRDAGFFLKADISTLKGAYEIGVMQTFEGKTYVCNVRQQLNVS